MRLYDPTSSGPQRALSRALVIASLEGMTVGILENGKLNAPEMLSELRRCSRRGMAASFTPSIPNPTPAPRHRQVSSRRPRPKSIF